MPLWHPGTKGVKGQTPIVRDNLEGDAVRVHFLRVHGHGRFMRPQ